MTKREGVKGGDDTRTIRMIWVQTDGGDISLWVAWDIDTIAEDPGGWELEVERVRKLCTDNDDYYMRLQEAHIPKVNELFDSSSVGKSTP
jgi:hypothetical protein